MGKYISSPKFKVNIVIITSYGMPTFYKLFLSSPSNFPNSPRVELASHSSALAWKNPMDGGAWWAAVHGVTNSRTRLSDFTFTFHFHALEKEMATHSSVLAWRIPGTGAWWAAVYGVAQSRTRLKRLSSSSSSRDGYHLQNSGVNGMETNVYSMSWFQNYTM